MQHVLQGLDLPFGGGIAQGACFGGERPIGAISQFGLARRVERSLMLGPAPLVFCDGGEDRISHWGLRPAPGG